MKRKILVLVALLLVPLACSNNPPPTTAAGAPPEQQRIVDRAAQSLRSMRQNPRLAERIEYFIAHARAIAIFPRLVKASVIFGGEGGNGVMVARRPDGSWSPPAFYSLGAASAGLQIGYQETSAVFFFMSDRTVQAAVDSDFRLGTDASVAAGSVGDGGQGVSDIASDSIYTFSEVGGAYVGVSFDGNVMGPRSKHNHAYYGAAVTPGAILFGAAEGVAATPPAGVAVLAQALGAPAHATTTTASATEAPAPATPTGAPVATPPAAAPAPATPTGAPVPATPGSGPPPAAPAPPPAPAN
jgi:lipid-binding SYLF domain-containing protein